MAAGVRASGPPPAPPPAPGSPPSARYVWYVIGLLTVVNVFDYMDRMALAVLVPAIQADLRLSDTQVGLLTGVAFALFYAVCGIPIARWADRGNRRNIIALALATWSLMTALAGAAQHFWQLLLARAGASAGEAGGYAPGASLLCDYVPFTRRAGVFAVYGFGLFAGMMVGMGLAGWLGETLGWRWTFVVLGLPGLALAGVVRLTLREPARGRFDAAPAEPLGMAAGSLGGTLGVLWQCRTYRLLLVFHILTAFVQFGFYQWLPSLYARVFGLSLSSVGLSLGLAIGAGSGLGLLLGGLVANRVAQRDVRLPLMLGAAANALALPAAVGAVFVSSAAGSLLLVAVAVLLWNAFGGAVLATLYSVTRPRMRATAGAVTTFASSMLGVGLGPLCIGVLSDRLTPSLGGGGLRYALLAPLALVPGMVITLYAAAKALPSDLRAVGAAVADDARPPAPLGSRP